MKKYKGKCDRQLRVNAEKDSRSVRESILKSMFDVICSAHVDE